MKPFLSTIYGANTGIRLMETLPWLLAIGAFFLLPDYLALGARILIFVILVLSLDLLVGFAGIVTLGHAAFFGIGAYTAGILSVRLGVADPLLQLATAAFVAGAFALITGALVLRTRGLTLIMMTLAVSAICLEVANRGTSFTGGADGLAGITVSPILGLFRFDLYGKTGYLYSLTVLFFSWVLIRSIIYSPFGASLAGLRDNRVRMDAVGAPIYRRLILTYVIAGAIAGVAGALLTQTNQFVGLNSLSFELAGELLAMLVLGGVGRLYGAFVGPVLYLIAQDQLAKQFPEHWYLGIGILLVVVVLFARGGVLGLCDNLLVRIKAFAPGGYVVSTRPNRRRNP